MISPLTFSIETRREAPEVGDLVTWVDYAGRKVGGRLTEWRDGNAWVTVVGLAVPEPYSIGDSITVDQSKVVDW